MPSKSDSGIGIFTDGQSGIGIRVSPVPLVTDKSGITQLGFFLGQLTLRRGLYHL
jgi:hypothetical protein